MQGEDEAKLQNFNHKKCNAEVVYFRLTTRMGTVDWLYYHEPTPRGNSETNYRDDDSEKINYIGSEKRKTQKIV